MAVAIEAAEKTFIIPYAQLYLGAFSNLHWLFVSILVLWLLLLFYLLYCIADRHFRWALEHLSAALELSPDLAGITLLAFGNGAPDFFTAVFGVSEAPELILGSSVGAGLFIVTVVFGTVILVARAPNVETVSDNGFSFMQHIPAVYARVLSPVPFIRGVLLYLLCIIFLGIFAAFRHVPIWMPCLLLATYFLYLALSFGLYFYAREGSRSALPVDSDPPSALSDAETKEQDKVIGEFANRTIFGNVIHALQSTYFNRRQGSFAKIGKICLAPVNLIVNLTIPPMEIPEVAAVTFDELVSMQYLHNLRRYLNPFGSLFVFIYLIGSGRDLASLSSLGWIAYGATAIVMCILLYCTRSSSGRPKYYFLHVTYGFAMCIVWIYGISSELVACLEATGLLVGVSTTVMGMLVLAWGNSFGDLVADSAISKNGYFETAASAVFSGPIQNVLLTIGVAFLLAAIRAPNHWFFIERLRSDIYIALALLSFVVTLCLVVIPLVFHFKIPRYYGVILISIYIFFLPFAILNGLGVLALPF